MPSPTTPSTELPVLAIDDLKVSFQTFDGQIEAVKGISLTVAQGRMSGRGRRERIGQEPDLHDRHGSIIRQR